MDAPRSIAMRTSRHASMPRDASMLRGHDARSAVVIALIARIGVIACSKKS
jgi:hypothetical protein